MRLPEVKRNALINVAGWIIPIFVLLALTPVMIEHLGTDGFGVIVIIQILTGYMTILNFGFSEAIIKQVAENKAQAPDRAMRILWAGLFLFAGAGLLGAITIYLCSDWLVYQILAIPDYLQDDAASALQVGSLVFLLQMIAEYYRGSALGHNRFDIPSVCKIIRVALSAILIYLALVSGGGLTSVMLGTLGGLVAGLLLNLAWMQRSLPMYWINHGYRNVLYELLHFGKHIFFSRLANMFSSKINQLFLGTLSSVSSVALYAVPVRVAESASSVLNTILQVFYPGFSSMDKKKDAGRIKSIYFSILSIQLFITVPLAIGAILEGPALLAIWIDSQFALEASSIINIVVVTYFLSALTGLPTYTAMSHNYPALISRYSIIRVCIVGITVYPLVKYFGITGAAWVLLLSELPAFAFIYEATEKSLKVNFYKKMAGPITKHAVTGLTLITIYEVIYRNSTGYHPSAAILVTGLHMVITYFSGAISKADSHKLLRLIKVW